MKLLLKKNIFVIFWFMVSLGCFALIADIPVLDLASKPLLMPVLMVAVLLRSVQLKGRNRILYALFFSFCGDVLLMFEDKSELYFMLGLTSFLITHLFYISYFLQIKFNGDSVIKNHPYIPLLIGLYTFGMLYLLWPNLGTLKVPVTLYSCVISIMLYLSLSVPFKTGKLACELFITGAVMFVISDSLLALNKFFDTYILAPVIIQVTYCLAQYFLVKGFIKKRY